MKNIKVLFCFEMLTVLMVCIRGYVRWRWPLYMSIGVGGSDCTSLLFSLSIWKERREEILQAIEYQYSTEGSL